MLPTYRLAKAIRDNCPADANEAIAAGADVNGRDEKGRSMLEMAERSESTSNIIGLLLLNGADASQSIGRFNDSLFHIAARRHNYGFAVTLVAHGHKPTARNDKGETPLHIAASTGQAFLCKFLVEHGVDTSLKDSRGRLACELAFTHHHMELAEWLRRRTDYIRAVTHRDRVAESPQR